jgi:hypothetical protein
MIFGTTLLSVSHTYAQPFPAPPENITWSVTIGNYPNSSSSAVLKLSIHPISEFPNLEGTFDGLNITGKFFREDGNFLFQPVGNSSFPDISATLFRGWVMDAVDNSVSPARHHHLLVGTYDINGTEKGLWRAEPRE